MNRDDIPHIPNYRILHELGQGGMAQVYLATQESLQRDVALKIMRPTLAVNPEFTERFRREGPIVAKLSHAGIVKVFDTGQHKGCHYIAMEYLAGGTLKQRIEQGMSASQVIAYLQQLCTALQHAHQQGLVHRDIKPHNILFAANDRPVLTDFGIAKWAGNEVTMTATGMSMGSPHYMSPEQIRGTKVSPRTDLYSLGVLMYEMLTGTVPYKANSHFAIANKHINDPLPRLPDEHAWLQSVLAGLMAKDPAERFADARKVSQTLQQLEQARCERETKPVNRPVNNSVDHTGARTRTEVLPADKVLSLSKMNAKARGRLPRLVRRAAILSSVLLAAGYGYLHFAQKNGATADTKAMPLLAASPNVPIPTRNEPLAQAPNATNKISVDLSEKERIAHTLTLAKQAKALHDQGQQTASIQLMQQAFEKDIDPQPVAFSANEIEQTARRQQRQINALKQEQSALKALRLQTEQKVAPKPVVSDKQEGIKKPNARVIEQLLALAQQQINANRLTTPSGDNAFATYREVLAGNKHNKAAQAGIQTIADIYLDWAKQARGKRQYQTSLRNIRKGLKVAPQHTALLNLHSDVQDLIKRQAIINQKNSRQVSTVPKLPNQVQKKKISTVKVTADKPKTKATAYTAPKAIPVVPVKEQKPRRKFGTF